MVGKRRNFSCSSLKDFSLARWASGKLLKRSGWTFLYNSLICFLISFDPWVLKQCDCCVPRHQESTSTLTLNFSKYLKNGLPIGKDILQISVMVGLLGRKYFASIPKLSLPFSDWTNAYIKHVYTWHTWYRCHWVCDLRACALFLYGELFVWWENSFHAVIFTLGQFDKGWSQLQIPWRHIFSA